MVQLGCAPGPFVPLVRYKRYRRAFSCPSLQIQPPFAPPSPLNSLHATPKEDGRAWSTCSVHFRHVTTATQLPSSEGILTGLKRGPPGFEPESFSLQKGSLEKGQDDLDTVLWDLETDIHKVGGRTVL